MSSATIKCKQLRELVSPITTGYICILGGGIVGTSLLKLFISSGQKCLLVDSNINSLKRIEEHYKKLGKDNLLETFNYSKDSSNTFTNKLQSFPPKFFISSAGIPPTNKMVLQLHKLKIKEISEIDLAVSFIGQPSIAITGTNGKTTIVQLIAHLSSMPALGNIGTPMSEVIPSSCIEAATLTELKYVVELSSYQLARSKLIKPKVAVISNIAPDHLSWHGDTQNYISAKLNIIRNQTKEDFLIVGSNSTVPFEILDDKAELINPKFIKKEGVIKIKASKLILVKDFPLIGDHNAENLTIAIQALDKLGYDITKLEPLICTFKSLDHRVSKFASIEDNKYHFINDSKSTNPHSTLTALKAVSTEYGAVLLLVGGYLKFSEEEISVYWNDVIKYIRNSDTSFTVACFGSSAPELSKLFNKKLGVDIYSYDKLEICIGDICSKLKSHSLNELSLAKRSCILLSPGCSSFDEFQNFEDRGLFFMNSIKTQMF